MVAVLRVRAVTKVVGVLLDHLFDRMKPPSTVKNHVLVAVWLMARVAVKIIACAAVAVGLMVVVMVVVLVKVAVQLALVVVQAVGEEFKMTSLAALVVILAMLAEGQMAQLAVRRVATVLGLHSRVEWWKLGLCVMVKGGGSGEFTGTHLCNS